MYLLPCFTCPFENERKMVDIDNVFRDIWSSTICWWNIVSSCFAWLCYTFFCCFCFNRGEYALGKLVMSEQFRCNYWIWSCNYLHQPINYEIIILIKQSVVEWLALPTRRLLNDYPHYLINYEVIIITNQRICHQPPSTSQPIK